MLDRFSETALNEAREYYKEHDAKENVKNDTEVEKTKYQKYATD